MEKFLQLERKKSTLTKLEKPKFVKKNQIQLSTSYVYKRLITVVMRYRNHTILYCKSEMKAFLTTRKSIFHLV